MKKDWLEILQLFSTTISGFLAEASILVATGFFFIILFAFLLTLLPQTRQTTLITMIFGVLILAAVRLFLSVIGKRWLFTISHANLVSVSQRLYHGDGQLQPDLSPIRNGRNRIIEACGNLNRFNRFSIRLHKLLGDRINKEKLQPRLAHLATRTLLRRTLLAAAVANTQEAEFAKALLHQYLLYTATEPIITRLQKLLWLLGFAADLAFFILVFVPIYFLFHSFSAPLLIGLILALILVSVFRKAFFTPLQQLALLNRFFKETIHATDHGGTLSSAPDVLNRLKID